jgi:MoaA/NifB/PqqE/SkfB family radical SAM enzyme
MKNAFEGWTFYESAFDTEKGTLVRTFEESSSPWGRLLDMHPSKHRQDLHDLWGKKYEEYGRSEAFSPVPETIDVQITNYCSVGCPTCYQSSTMKDKHPQALKLVKAILDGLDEVPYQIAYGGGEPTQLPGFTKILELTHQRGVVPNFTTSGVVLDEEIGSCARDLCGGVALTYHYWRGREKFETAYRWWKEQLGIKQLNVHVIADKDVMPALNDLAEIDPQAKLVLLAYYPDVGRASLKALMPHSVYRKTLPDRLIELRAQGMQVAFSEGLLPWTLSHPELGLATAFAGPQEGKFSCYVDSSGRVSESSFRAPHKSDESIHKVPLQLIWNKGWYSRNQSGGAKCSYCKYSASSCASPSPYHTLLCEFQPHNSGKDVPLTRSAMAEVLRDALYADKEAKGLGIHTKEQQDEISMRLFDVKHEQLLRY